MYIMLQRKRKNKWRKCSILLVTLFLLICLCQKCSYALSVSEREIYTSPQGTNTIIVEYDHVCRPYVYRKTWFGKKHIWTYPGGGFMETVSFELEWLSEDKIRMSYDDKNDEYNEEFTIEIPCG